jgi:hypothetical protein
MKLEVNHDASPFDIAVFCVEGAGLIKMALRNLQHGALSSEHAGIFSTAWVGNRL